MKLTEQQRQELGNALGAALGLGRDTEVNPQWSALTKLVPHVEKLLDDTCEALAQKIEAYMQMGMHSLLGGMTTTPEDAIDAAEREFRTSDLDGRAVIRAAIEAAMPALREAIAQEIEAAKDYETDLFRRATLGRAARIARGGTP